MKLTPMLRCGRIAGLVALCAAPGIAGEIPRGLKGIVLGDEKREHGYSEEQAQRGRQVFRDACAECHYSSEMRDDAFQFEWERRTVGDLLEHVTRSMPDDAPGSLPTDQYVDVIAYILQLNGFAAGTADLTADHPGLATSLRAPGP